MSDQFFWFATRSAGILAWFAATLALGSGLLMSSRALGTRPTIPWMLDVHRFLSGMSVIFLAIHLLTLWADSFVNLTVADLLIPGRAVVPGLSSTSLILGVLSAWILVVVEASSLISKYLPTRFWHTLHLTSFGVVIMGLVHAVQAGSDSDNRVLMATVVSLLTATTLLLATRVYRLLVLRKFRFELEIEEDPADGHAEVARRDPAPPPGHRRAPGRSLYEPERDLGERDPYRDRIAEGNMSVLADPADWQGPGSLAEAVQHEREIEIIVSPEDPSDTDWYHDDDEYDDYDSDYNDDGYGGYDER